MPMSLSGVFASGNQMFVNAYVGMDDYTAPALGETGGSEENGDSSVSNAQYSLVSEGRVPAVRNQGSFGTCWSFSTLAAAESNIITQGLADTSVDLSEMQLVYYMYHPAVDPLGNITEGEGSERTDGETVAGGRSDYAMSVLARWNAVADETKIPYSWASSVSDGTKTLTNDYATDYNEFVINGYYAINNKKNASELKAAIQQYGAATVAYYADDENYNAANSSFFSGSAHAGSTNHAVSIVGWDDNYSRENFGTKANGYLRPENDGAWLIRNSWGSSWGDRGYFWISYEDESIEDTSFIVIMQKSDTYDNNYYYDGGTMYSPSAKVHGAVNIFESKKDAELLKAVSVVFPTETNVNYSVDIYVNSNGKDFDPDFLKNGSVKPVASAHTEGETTFAGMYTIELNNPVALSAGDKFAVVIRTDEAVSISYDKNSSAYWFTNNASYEDGCSFFINGSGSLSSMESRGVARIKAYTETVDDETVLLAADDIELYEGDCISAGEYLSVSPEEAELTFAVADESVASIDSLGKVTALSVGKTSLEIRCASANVKATALITVLPHEYTLVEAVSATCTEDGNEEYYICSHGYYYTLENGEYVLVEDEASLVIPAAGHTPDEASRVEAVPVTDYTDGNIEYYTCSVCGVLIAEIDGEYTEITEAQTVIPAAYILKKISARDKTCTSDGNIEFYFVIDKNTGETVKYIDSDYNDIALEDTVIPAGHMLQKTEAVAASCVTGSIGNIEYYTCSVCSKYFADENAEKEISRSSTVEYPAHSMTKTNAVAPTCTEPGNVQYYYCSVCERYYKYASGSTELFMDGENANIIIPAKGHSPYHIAAKDASCTVDGNKEYYVCKVCDKLFEDEACAGEITKADTVIKAIGHNYEGEVTASPTCTEAGTATYTCANNCGSSYTEILPAFGHSIENGVCARCGLSEDDISAKENAELGGRICDYCGKRHGTSVFANLLYAIHGIFKFFSNLFNA